MNELVRINVVPPKIRIKLYKGFKNSFFSSLLTTFVRSTLNPTEMCQSFKKIKVVVTVHIAVV